MCYYSYHVRPNISKFVHLSQVCNEVGGKTRTASSTLANRDGKPHACPLLRRLLLRSRSWEFKPVSVISCTAGSLGDWAQAAQETSLRGRWLKSWGVSLPFSRVEQTMVCPWRTFSGFSCIFSFVFSRSLWLLTYLIDGQILTAKSFYTVYSFSTQFFHSLTVKTKLIK